MADDELTLQESPDFVIEIIPEDTEVEAVLKVCKKQETRWVDEDTGEKQLEVSFAFELEGDEYRYQSAKDGKFYQKRLYGQTSTTFSTNSKCRLYLWVKEIMGVDELPSGYTLRLGALEGNPVRIVVGERRWTDKKTQKEEVRNYVKDVMRARNVQRVGDVSSSEEPF